MDKQTGDRILTLFNRAREDSDFQRLNEEMRMSNGCVVALIRQLPQRQWDILIDHLGLIQFPLGHSPVWALIYSITKNRTERLNEALKQKQQNP